MSRQARRFERNSNTRVRKVIGESGHQPKQKFVEDRGERAKVVMPTPKNHNQKLLMASLNTDIMVLVNGSGGSGKSFCVLAHAAKQLLDKKVEKIVLYRPYQPLANRTVGFLKGSANEKMMPFFAQQVAYLEQFLGKTAVQMAIENGTIELGLLEAARGRSFENAIVVIDESQLLTPAEAQALSTRIGENCQVVFVGDSNQRDDRKKDSGLSYLERIVNDYMIEDVGIIKFTANDIVRSGITKAFVKAFDQEGYL